MSANDIEQSLGFTLTDHQKNNYNNNKLDKYVLPASDRQIQTLLTKLNNPYTYFRLCLLICKFLKPWKPSEIFYLLNKNNTDMQIYNKIFVNTRKMQSVREFSKIHVAEYLLNIIHNITRKFSPKTYLDIGCGTGIFTRDFGQIMNIPNMDIIGADVENEFEESWNETRPKEINYYVIKNNKLDIKKKFDIITCMMVLHHVPPEYTEYYVKRVYELLNPGGIFILKEHDCLTAADWILADIEHSLYIAKEYITAHGHNGKLPDLIKNKISEQVIHYKNRFAWQLLMVQAGFNCLYEAPYDLSVNNDYSPDRSYIAIFQKK